MLQAMLADILMIVRILSTSQIGKERRIGPHRRMSAAGQFPDSVHSAGDPRQKLPLAEDLDRLAIGLALGGLSQLGDAQWLVGPKG